MSEPTILVVTGRDDVHADAVISGLGQRANVVRLNTDNFVENCTYDVSTPDWDGNLWIRDSNRRSSFGGTKVVWYRKPVPLIAPEQVTFEPARKFIVQEHNAFLRSLWDLLADRFWVSSIWAIRRAEQKLANLRLAAALGLRVPRTIVTNDPDKAKQFAQSCQWNVIVKPFALESFSSDGASTTSWDTFTSTFNEAVFEARRESIRLAPVQIQESVAKTVELRVTVMGKTVFCTAIDSQAHPDATTDWRAAEIEELKHRPYDLPTTVSEQLLKFNRHFGLQFSTFDIIVRNDGALIWLECNPNGQWLWIEKQTGQPLVETMVNLLTNPADWALR